jgi:Copine
MAIVNKSVVQQQEQQDPISRLANQSRALNLSQGDEEEPDIAVVASASDMFEADAADMAKMMDPTFANYMAGGCEINAIIAIDATSKNGDPHQPTSLHSFGATNPYQQALQSLVSILAKYDSDQQYPVYGFGARVDGGVVNHCFPFGAAPLHDGVDGVLKAYDQTFKSGLIMSSPRDFSQVIRTATIDAKERLEKGHAYSVLLLFTSGAPADMSQTIAALEEADDAPLSIVIVGVSRDGETGATMSDFGSLPQLEQRCHQTTTVDGAQRPRDNVRFVSYANFKHDREKLAEAALQQIPHQLVEYFSTRQIYPNPEQDGQDEIVVQPYNEKDEVVVPIQFLQSGQVAVTGNVQPPATVSSDTTTNGTSHKTSPRISKTVEFGQQIWNMAKKNKQFGRIQRKATAEIKKQIKRKFPQARFVL